MQKVSELISTIRNSKYLGLIAILVLVAIIPITVLVAQMNQDIRQRASEVSLSPVSPVSPPNPISSTPTNTSTTPLITGIIIDVNRRVTITGERFFTISGSMTISVRDGKGGVWNMGSPQEGGIWTQDKIIFTLPNTFTWQSGYMMVYRSSQYSNQFPFSLNPAPNPASPTPTVSPQIKVSFRTSSGTPISQKFCSACFNANGGYVRSYACYTGSDVTIPKPAVCSGNTYNPTVGIDTKRSDIVNGNISGVTATPTAGFRSLYNSAYLGWTDGTKWTSGERTLNIIVNPRPSPTPYRRVTPTPILSTPKITSINVMSVNKVVTITGQNFLNAANVNSEQYVSVRDGKGGVWNMGSPKAGGRWSANQIQFQLSQNFSWRTGYMLIFSNNKWSNQFPFSY